MLIIFKSLGWSWCYGILAIVKDYFFCLLSWNDVCKGEVFIFDFLTDAFVTADLSQLQKGSCQDNGIDVTEIGSQAKRWRELFEGHMKSEVFVLAIMNVENLLAVFSCLS